MNRKQKEATVRQLQDMFSASQAAFLVNYKGLTVAQMEELRCGIREKRGSFKVTKARLMKRAAGDRVDQAFVDSFKEQVALVFADDEVPGVAKAVTDFAKNNEPLEVVGGFFESKFLTQAEVTYLASIPSREVLLAQVAGLLNMPMVQLVTLLSQLLARLARVLGEIEKQKKA